MNKTVNDDSFSIEQIKSFDNKIANQYFNSKEINVLKTILSHIKGNTEDYLFNLSIFTKLGFDLEKSEKELLDCLKKISNYYIEIQNGYGDLKIIGLIENRFLIDLETNILSIKINKDLIPFLINLKEQYNPVKIN